MSWEQWVSAVLLVVGAFVGITGSLGVLRMPDFYSRLHPAGKSDTAAQALVIVGLVVLVIPTIESNWGLAVKLVLLTALLFVTAPTGTHAISKAALLDPRMPRHWVHPDEEAAHGPASAGATDTEGTEEDRRVLAAEDEASERAGQPASDRPRRDGSSLTDRGRHPDWAEQVDEEDPRDE